ncbi:MAG: NAD(P)/FAD-dependent oxidoreductase [Chloroflexi bacterium]|nr:NAD(P)/FAD-dependent oxidoreductase [Chloroflexota bacterium]
MAKKVVVIGSGVGGAAAAALLAKEGHQITLLESHHFPGGRCASMGKEGFTYDFGVHMFSRGNKGPHGTVNRRVGGDLAWITRDPACHVMGRVEFDFRLNIRPLLRQFSVARQLGVRPKNYIGAFRLMRSLLSGRGVEKNDGVCLQDYVSRFTNDDMVHLFMNCLSQLYFALSYRQSSAGEFIWCFSRMFNEASFGYPLGGSGRIPGSFLQALERHGGEVRLREPVAHICIENGKVTGVETASGRYDAELVISDAGIVRTLDLAGRQQFPEEDVKRAEGLSYSNAYVTLKYALDRRVIPYPVVFHMPSLPPERVFDYVEEKRPPDDPYIFMPVPSNIDPNLAPSGRQLVVAGTAAPAGATPELCDAILDRVHTKVCELFPGFKDSIMWQLRSTRVDATALTDHLAGEAIGIGQTPGQVGALRPELVTPVSGLWLVGADAGSRGIGTEMASGSALNLIHRLGDGSGPEPIN